ncbi:CD151 antigen-like [Patiria miniata]|uniref:Tetraspanin n=1 Tax=Patiria miniata TaxID=46514 RepID=A0A913ZKU0_PATMI|nr:CD151 antigen-like [Patiria miniata]XP_038052424.1 CD151 antigen-like [Patiria miniata]
MAQGCGASMSKIILFIFNALVWVASIILIAIGGYVLNNSSKYDNLFGESSNTLTVVCGFLIGVGCFIFLVGFLGCCGACMENGCFLKLYFVFLLVLVLVEFIGGILAFVYRNDIKKFIQDELDQQVKQFYGEPDQKVVTGAVDDLQRDEKCCGVVDYTDYYNSTFATLPQFTGEAVPQSCCKDQNDDTCNAARANGTIADVSKIYTDGCMAKLVKIFEDNFVYIGVAALVLILVEISAMIMSCCLISGIGKKDDYKSYA